MLKQVGALHICCYRCNTYVKSYAVVLPKVRIGAILALLEARDSRTCVASGGMMSIATCHGTPLICSEGIDTFICRHDHREVRTIN
jgi:hypothetical protein